MKPAAVTSMHADAPAPPLLHYGVVLVLLAVVLWRLLLPALHEENFGIIIDAKRGLFIQDFAAHLTFAKAFWSGKAGYDVQSHLRITSTWAGQPVQQALPFGYSPTMLWVLAPLCLMPTVWGYVAWTLLGLATVWWMTRPRWAIWLAAALCSPLGFICFVLGQTAVLTTASMLFLMLADFNRQHRGRTDQPAARSDWLSAAVLWALTAKPPIALTVAVVLLGHGRRRSVARAFALALLSTALLTPLLGVNWVREYVHLMTHYDLETAHPAYAWSLVPEAMGNLRALLHVIFGVGDATASRLAGGLWLFALLGIVTAGLRRKLPTAAAWGLSVLAYLLLCPHVTATEELHLVLVLVLFTHPVQRVAGVARWTAVALVMTVLFLPPGIGHQGALRLPIVCGSKVLIATLVLLQWGRSPGGSSGVGGGNVAPQPA